MGSAPLTAGLPDWTPVVLGRRDGGKLTDSQDCFHAQDPEDRIGQGDRHRFTLTKTDAGQAPEARSSSRTESIRVPS